MVVKYFLPLLYFTGHFLLHIIFQKKYVLLFFIKGETSVKTNTTLCKEYFSSFTYFDKTIFCSTRDNLGFGAEIICEWGVCIKYQNP